jgi:DNA-binding beta-propeller fold protein YncE
LPEVNLFSAAHPQHRSVARDEYGESNTLLTERIMKKRLAVLLTVFSLFALKAQPQEAEPLKLIETIPMPGLHDGDFDHFAVSVPDHLLFLTAEENSAVEVFDLRTNKLIHTISDLKAPHSMVYRADLKKLFVVDGDAAEVKIYQGDSYKPAGSIKLTDDADSSAYDPATKYMYVVNGGKGAHVAYTLISVIDTTADKKLADIKIDSESVEAMALEKSGPLMFANVPSSNTVAVIDREKRTVIAHWSVEQEGKKNAAMGFDEADHRLFVVTRDPAKVVVLDSKSGKIVGSLPCSGSTDDAVYDPGSKRLYVAGVPFLTVYELRGPNRFRQIGQVPTSFHAVTGILVPELNRYYLAVNHHGDTEAEIRVYQVIP